MGDIIETKEGDTTEFHANGRNLVPNSEVYKEFIRLSEEGYLTQNQVLSLREAMNMSKYIYSGIARREEYRTQLNGHINLGVLQITRNNEAYSSYTRLVIPTTDREFIEDMKSQIRVFSEDYENTNGLYELLLTYIGHDWYEDFQGSEEELNFLKYTVKQKFGERIHSNIETLSKVKGVDMNEYSDKLRSSNSRVVVAVKSIDRRKNLEDDFGGINWKRNRAYLAETKQSLLPIFEAYRVPFLSEFKSLVDDLEIDIYSREVVESVVKRMFIENENIERRRSDWREHKERMIEELKVRPELRGNMGIKLAILMHDDIGDINLTRSFLQHFDDIRSRLQSLDESYDIDFYKRVIEKSQELALFSVGIALSASKYDDWSVERRKDINSYQVEDKTREHIKEINESKVEWTFDQIRGCGLLFVTANPFQPDKSMEILAYDIEGLLVASLEKLDNLQNPPKIKGNNNEGGINSAYQWKTIQELALLLPLLEIGGFNSLVQYSNGKIYEYQYAQEIDLIPEIRRQYDEQVELFRRYEKLIQRLINSNPLTPDSGVFINIKSFGSVVRKVFEQMEEHGLGIEEITIGDIIRATIIFEEDLNVEKLGSRYDEWYLKLRKMGVEVNMKFEHSHPLGKEPKIMRGPIDSNQEIDGYAMSYRRYFTSIQNYLKVVFDELVKNNSMRLEIQAVTQEMHFENTFGRGSHLLYELQRKWGVMMDEDDLLNFIKNVLRRTYTYKISPFGSMILSAAVCSYMEQLDLGDADLRYKLSIGLARVVSNEDLLEAFLNS